MARKANKRHGYTLIELCVVIVVLALMSAAIVPNLVRAREGLERREFEAKVYRLASWARETAIRERKTLALTVSDRSFSVIEETEDGEEGRRSLPMPVGVETGSLAAEGEDATTNEWRLRFYSDGSSDGGGVELSDNGRIRTLEVKPDGSMRVIEGNLEESGTEKWNAGEIEKRA